MDINQWLAEDQNDIPEWNTDEEENAVKQEMWANIQQKTSRFTHERLPRRIYRIYLPAACVLLVLFATFKYNPFLFSREVIINNLDGSTATKVTIDNLQLTVQPNSSCILKSSLWRSAEKNIRFCGAVSVINKSDKKATLHFNSDSENCDNISGSDMIRLYKGQTYMVMTDKQYNLIAATKTELLDGIPQSFSSRLTERFKL